MRFWNIILVFDDFENFYFSFGARVYPQADTRSCADLDNKPEFIREILEKLLKK